MSIRNTSENYGSLAKWFHWISAVLIIGMLILGTIFTTLIHTKALKSELIDIHKSIALVILVLIIFRWIWRYINPKPKILTTKNTFLVKATHIFHELLYLAIVIMLLSGLVMTVTKHKSLPFFSFFTIQTTWFPKNHALHEFSGTMHLIFAWTISTMLCIHILAALKHHFYYKDETIKRMLPKKP